MATFAEKMLTKVKCLLEENVGLESVSVEGTDVRYVDLLKQLDYWESKVAREQGNRPRVSQIKLGGL